MPIALDSFVFYSLHFWLSQKSSDQFFDEAFYSILVSFLLTVMEVASGDYGEAVHKLVMAVSSGKCTKYNNIIADDSKTLTVTNNGATTISNDISKSNSSPSKLATTTSNAMTATAQISSNGKDQEFLKLTKGDTVINIPTNDDLSVKAKTSGCTTSLLDSSESVVCVPRKNGFPVSGFAQFWILLKRAFLTIIRDKQLTQMRLFSHVIVGAIIGMIYYDVGNEASKVMSNAGCIFFTTLFTMFTAMMPTILTCKFGFHKRRRKILKIFFLFSSNGNGSVYTRTLKLLVLTESFLLCQNTSRSAVSGACMI